MILTDFFAAIINSKRVATTALFILAMNSTLARSEPALSNQERAIPNLVVQDQFGRDKQFYSDLVEGKLVAINFIFTRCEMICPISGFKFSQLRKAIAADDQITFDLISMTTDAPYDSPERLKVWAEKFGAGGGWSQITGDKKTMDTLLKSMQAFAADRLDHTTLILLMNDKLGTHKWVDGNISVDDILLAAGSW
jgi:protein SCO1/2